MCKQDSNWTETRLSKHEFSVTQRNRRPEYKGNEILGFPVDLEINNTTALTNKNIIFLFDIFVSYFSSWTKLKQCLAWLTRFKRYLHKKAMGSAPLSPNVLDNAEDLLKFMEVSHWIKRHKHSDSITSKNYVINWQPDSCVTTFEKQRPPDVAEAHDYSS